MHVCECALQNGSILMPSAPAGEIPHVDPAISSGERRPLDFLLSSVFLVAASFILAFENPVNVEFQPRLVETLGVCLAGTALLVWANLRRSLLALLLAAAILLVTVGAGTMSQPAQVNLPVVAIWPMRIAIVVLVGFAWAFLLQPPPWFRRGLIAFALPTAAFLLFFIVPPAWSQAFKLNNYRPINNKFAPYWLAINGHGGLYVTDLDGVYVWAFDSSGTPQGTLNAAKAPPVPTPGPGIIPSGLQTELTGGTFQLGRGTPTPIFPGTGTIPRGAIPNFDFCGMATDPSGNLYLIDLFDPTGYKLLRFDEEGNITARWEAPAKFQPTNGCIAADSQYIYLSSVEGSKDGTVHILDHAGKEVRQVGLPFLPLAISANDKVPGSKAGEKVVVVIGPGMLQRLDVNADSATLTPLKAAPNELQVPILLLSNGEVLLSDHQNLKAARFDPVNGTITGILGKPGTMPGELGDVGGLAEDAKGNIFMSDPVHRVIQKFSPDGRVSAVWWAQTLNGEVEQEEGGR